MNEILKSEVSEVLTADRAQNSTPGALDFITYVHMRMLKEVLRGLKGLFL